MYYKFEHRIKLFIGLLSINILAGLNLFAQNTTVTITCTGASGSYNSGSVNAAGVINDGDLTTLSNAGNRGWATFDLSTIPMNATVINAEINFNSYSSTGSGTNKNIYGFIGTPLTMAGTLLFSNCASGSSLNSNSWNPNSLNSNSPFNAYGRSFIQSNEGGSINLGFVNSHANSSNVYSISGYGSNAPTLTITYSPPVCLSPLNPGNTLCNKDSVCSGSDFVLSLQNQLAGTGITYEWQYSNNINFTSFSSFGANSSETTQQSTARYYRCSVRCNGGTSYYSTPVFVPMTSIFYKCYCEVLPSIGSPLNIITNVKMGTLDNTSTYSTTPLPYFTNYNNTPVVITSGTTQNISISLGSGAAQHTAVWIDYDHNSIFSYSEKVAQSSSPASANAIINYNVSIPLNASLGITRMRVMGGSTSIYTSPCGIYQYGETEDYLLDIVGCSNPLNLGNTIASVDSACAGVNFGLWIQNNPIGGGLSYQWQKSTNPAFTTYSTQNGDSTAIFNQISSSYYRCKVICSGGTSYFSNTLFIPMNNSFYNCYCFPQPYNSNSNNPVTYITEITLGSYSNTSTFSTNYPAFYSKYNNIPIPVIKGTSQAMTITVGPGNYQLSAVWIDFNHDGTFSASENVALATVGASSNATIPYLISIPTTAMSGPTRMRVRAGFSGYSGAGGACVQDPFGETEDYLVDIVDCIDPTNLGNPIASSNPVCANQTLTLSLPNPPIGPGITYQWLSSNDGVNFTNISGANSSTYNSVQNLDTYYKCDVTCSNGPTTVSSTTLFVEMDTFLNCYCIPVSNETPNIVLGCITNVSLSSINNTTVGCSSGIKYSLQSATTDLIKGSNYSIGVQSSAAFSAAFGIDYNHDAVFSANEWYQITCCGYPNQQVSVNFSIPSNALTGITRLRVRVFEGASGPFQASYSCSPYPGGETEDYNVNIIPCVITNHTIVTSCDKYQWAINNMIYQGSGNYFETFTDLSGCLHEEFLNLTIHPSTLISILDTTVCGSAFTWADKGTTYFQSTSDTFITGINVNGCPEYKYLNLTLLGKRFHLYDTTCASYTWDANDSTYFTSGNYEWLSFHNSLFCPDTFKLHLVVFPTIISCNLTNSIPIRTGYDYINQYTMNPGNEDPNWRYGINDFPPLNKPIVDSRASASNLYQSKFISNSEIADNDTITYRRHFKNCLSDTLTFNLDIAYDNYLAGIYIDGVLITSPNTITPIVERNLISNFSLSQNYTFSLFVPSGLHNLDFKVGNNNAIWGLQVQGTIIGQQNSLVSNLNPANCCCNPCPIPANLSANYDVGSAYTATATWDNIAGISNYFYKFKPINGSVWTNGNSTTNFKTITGLQPCTTYEFCVRILCPGNTFSIWVCDTFTTGNDLTLNVTTNNSICGGYGSFNVLTNGGNNTISIDPCPLSAFPCVYTGSSFSTSSIFPQGIYTITLTDANGCTKSQTTEILPLPQLAVSLLASPFNCNTQIGGITGAISGGTSPYNYQITNTQNQGIGNSSNGTFSETLIGGSYTVAVTDANGCTTSQTFIIQGFGTKTTQNVTVCNYYEWSCNNSAQSLVVAGTYQCISGCDTLELNLTIDPYYNTCTPTNSIIINTGYNHAANTIAGGNGTQDPTWFVSESNSTIFNPALLYNYVGWGASNPNSSFINNNGIDPSLTGIRTYRRNFKTCKEAMLTFELNLAYDNSIEGIFIDGQLISNPITLQGQSTVSSNFHSFHNYTFNHFLIGGEHTLDIKIWNQDGSLTNANGDTIGYGTPHGLNVYGTISSTVNAITSNTSSPNCCCYPCVTTTTSIYETACGQYFWQLNNQVYTTSGIYTYTLETANGCDSIILLNLTITSPVSCTNTNSIIINTGYDPVSQSLIPYTFPKIKDPKWVVKTPVDSFFHDVDVADAPPFWISNLNSHWILGDYYVGDYTYRREFKTCSDDMLMFYLEMSYDNLLVCIKIDGNSIVCPAPTDPLNNGTFGTFQNYSFSLFLTAGTHTLEFIVNNSGSPSGLNINGTITAQNSSLVTNTSPLCCACIPTHSTILLKTFLQGYYNSNSTMTPALLNQGISTDPSITDTITVELNDTNAPYELVHSTQAILNTNGQAIANFPLTASGNSYFLAIKHRNAIETWSANPIVILSGTLYDFSSSQSQAYGGNQVEVEPGVYALYSGDINQDGFVDSFDFPALDTDIYNGVSGVYVNTDLNGDGFVDSFDFPIFDLNSSNGVSAITP